MRQTVIAALAAVLLAAVAPLAPAQPAPPNEEGVPVGKMSGLRGLVSEEQLEAQARQQYASIKQQAAQQDTLAPDDHPQLLRLRAIAKKIIPTAVRWNQAAAKWQWEVNLIGSKQVNAFCMPGGKIAFYSGILSTLKLTDDEVATVMSHEIAHALREHGRERAAKSTMANVGARLAGVGLSALLGIDPGLANMAVGGVANLTMLKFSRDDETEADLVGMDIAARAGYDPRAGVALWEKMAMLNKGAPPQWLSTHPAGANRISQIQQNLPAVMPLYARVKGTSLASLPPYRSNVAGLTAIQ